MKGKAENTRSALLDTLMLLASAVLLLGGLGAYYYYQDLANMPARVGGLIAVAVIAALLAAQTEKGGTFFRFLKEADIERRKVIWPSHQETIQTSLMVIVVTILISLFLAAVDWMIGAAVRALLTGG
jgi:preprotein translocase subunit SecE